MWNTALKNYEKEDNKMKTTFQKFTVNLLGDKREVIVINYKPEKETISTYDEIHHVEDIDRSGSMYSYINRLIDNVQKTIEVSGEKDIFTIGWFSGPNEYAFPIKGAAKHDRLNILLDSLRNTLNTTCFSDSFNELGKVLIELKAFNLPVSITLFTDGNPVVPWSENEEKRRIYESIEKIKSILGDKLVAINTIGYGYDYNKELLVDISSMSQYGTFTHSNVIDQYLEIFRLNHEKVKGNISDQVDINVNGKIVYLTRKFSKYIYSMATNTLHLDSIDREKNQFFILLNHCQNSFTLNGEKYKIYDIDTIAQDSTINNFLYSMVYNLYYNGKYLDSLNILSENLRDKYLVDSHFSSFTFDERAEHVKKLKYALLNTKDRLQEGECSLDYVPKKDALCVMDVLNTLKNIEALWLPFDKAGEEYKRIGVHVKDTFDMFVSDNVEIRSSFEDMVFNKEKLNMSLRVVIPGHVKLNPKQAKKVGLETEFKCRKFRNFTLIKNGNLNIQKLVCFIPEVDKDKITETIKIDSIDGIKIEDKSYVKVVIDLSILPVINQLYAEKASNIDNIFDNVFNTLTYECEQKIVNYYLSLRTDVPHLQKTGAFKELTIDQIELLKEHGIDKNSNYSGIGGEEQKTGDSYVTRELDFYIAGFSSLPALKDIEKRIYEGKNLTPSMEMLNGEWNHFRDKAEKINVDLDSNTKFVKEWLDKELKTIKITLNKLRSQLAIWKMAIVLTGNWFKLEVDDKNNYYYEKNGHKMICRINYKTVEL
jgi:hypothetical protein